jgi:histidinol-phosphate aminotransferase
MSSVLELARPELRDLKAYRHAAWEPSLERMHANELPWRVFGDNSRSGLNRYPEPQPRVLVERLAQLYGVDTANVLVGRGSDEAIDLLVRGFCRAGRDSVMVFPPTFGMYEVAAHIQGAGVIAVPLESARDFSLDVARALDEWRPDTKILFVCSPNNPTGHLAERSAIERLCASLAGKALVVVDEAYIEFARVPSLVDWLGRFPHLVVLRTLSKAHGLAGARCGTLIADPALVELLRRMIPPFAITAPTVEVALHALEEPQRASSDARIALILSERQRLADALAGAAQVRKVWPSAANFLLVECGDATRVLQAGISAGLLVRDVRSQPGLGDALRITVGSPEQNDRLIRAVALA